MLNDGDVNVDTVEVDPVFGTTGSFLTVTLALGSSASGPGGAVDSVNGEVGVVVLDATDVGADPTGTATAAVSSHAGLSDPHPGYLTPAEGNAAYDVSGAAATAQAAAIAAAATDATTKADEAQAAAEATAASALSTHEADTTAVHGIADTSVLATDAEVATAVSDHAAAANPHPTYLTQAEGDAAYDAIGAAAAAQAASQPVDSDLTAIAALTTTAFGRGLLALADAAALRTSAGLILGTDVYSKSAVDAGFQPLDSDLTAIAALTTTSYGRALLAVADLAALRTILGPTGTPSSTTFLRGDGTWNTPAGGSALASVTAIGSGSGDYTTTSTTMVDVNASLSAVIAAVAGDVLIATFSGAVYGSLSSFMELGLNIGGTVRRSNGITCGASAVPVLVQVRYVVQSGDISGGLVTVKPQWKKASGSMSMVNDTTDRKPTVIVMNTLQ